MPELPEVEALARWLDRELAGDVVARIDVTSINALKTYDPPPSASVASASTSTSLWTSSTSWCISRGPAGSG
jgi:formamidopyrimidine-DNA glycosylase